MNKLKAQVTQIAGGILTAGYFVLYEKNLVNYSDPHATLLYIPAYFFPS